MELNGSGVWLQTVPPHSSGPAPYVLALLKVKVAVRHQGVAADLHLQGLTRRVQVRDTASYMYAYVHGHVVISIQQTTDIQNGVHANAYELPIMCLGHRLLINFAIRDVRTIIKQLQC